ncbi:YihY/virulence factor BrkB family protein [Cellulosimicrobium cellulans]|uniref:YihY/virulence factor BrkB family protein n=1 Tax=Cellulosimicrobium cellulans TaxID=1710 RepID=UPI0008485CE8|nr:YhjD/YihY/BrkB family envelope integrity protein [Cellulosimicrobium cellulans]
MTSADTSADGGSPAHGRPSLVDRAKRVMAWWTSSRPGRSFAWYNAQHGPILCGGMAYAALFSLFAALAIGWTVFMAVLGSRTDLRDAVLEQIDTWLPGLVGTGGSAVLTPDQLVLDNPVTVTSVVALGVLIFSAVAFMAALRSSVQAMFDVPPTAQNPVLAKARELGGFVLLGVGILVSAAASVVVSGVGTWLADLLGGSVVLTVVVRGLGIAVGLLVDAVVVALVVVLVGGVRPARRDLVLGSLVAAAAFGALRYLGTSIVVGSASRNALLASFTVLVTLLVLVNVVARVLLMVCAWMADPPELPAPGEEDDAGRDGGGSGPGGDVDRDAARARWTTEERVRAGQGRGRPWSAVVRGVRRGRLTGT